MVECGYLGLLTTLDGVMWHMHAGRRVEKADVAGLGRRGAPISRRGRPRLCPKEVIVFTTFFTVFMMSFDLMIFELGRHGEIMIKG